LAIPGVSNPYSAFWILAHSDGPTFHLLWLFCSTILVPPWCTLLAERSCLHCHSSNENDAIKVKLRSRDHSSTNSKHACAEGSVINLKRCYCESVDNFWLTYVITPTTTNKTFNILAYNFIRWHWREDHFHVDRNHDYLLISNYKKWKF
jgi:hypothetical protein